MKGAAKSLGPWLFACVLVVAVTALVATGHEAFVIHAVGVCAAVVVFLFILGLL